MFVIDDATGSDVLHPQGSVTGLAPRDYTATPLRSVEMLTIPRSEWSARIKEMEETKSRLSDIWFGAGNAHLDQNGQGYCWAYSSVHAVMVLRAVNHQPAVRLSAHAVACKIKGFRDEGAWSALSLDFIQIHGIPSVASWPEKSMRREHDNPGTWAEAAQYRVTESWVDVAAPVWDRDLSFDQVMTCLLSRVPVACDFNWWGHAVCALDPVEVEPGSFGVRILNSWAGWGDRGMGVLRGTRAVPSNAVAVRAVTAAGG